MRHHPDRPPRLLRAAVKAPIACGLVVTVAIALTTASALQTPGKTLNVRDFGAKGDGASDDYEAMKRAAAALCATPGASLAYPPGTYKVLRFKIEEGPRANGVTDVVYDHCRDVSVVGDGARIEVTGGFHRAFDHMVGRFKASYITGVVPFDFVNSTGFVIRGFDISGNAQETTRDPDVTEQPAGAGIRTAVSSQYTIRDVHVHHFATDGLLLGGGRPYGTRPGGPLVADRNATLMRVVSDHNARNGMSLVQVRGASIVESTFSDNGRTGGAYGGHAPRSGVDIEPVRKAPNVDVETGDIRFLNSRFQDNLGMQLVTGGPGPVAIDRVDVENCYVRGRDPEGFFIAFLVFPRIGTVKGCRFDVSSASGAQRRRTVFLHGFPPPIFPYFKQLTYQDNTFNIDANAGVTSDPQGESLNISFVDNTITIHATGPDPTVLKLEGLRAVTGNKVYVDATGYAGTGEQVIIRYDGTKMIRGNTYTTNLTGGGKGYRIEYPADGTVTNETYVGGITR